MIGPDAWQEECRQELEPNPEGFPALQRMDRKADKERSEGY